MTFKVELNDGVIRLYFVVMLNVISATLLKIIDFKNYFFLFKVMTAIQILTDFRQGLISFFDELIEQFPKEGDLIVLRIFIGDQVPILDIMNTFIARLLPLREMVKARDEKFFLENDILFQKLNPNKVSYFKQLWMSDELDAEDRMVIWQWFDSFIILSERYRGAAGRL